MSEVIKQDLKTEALNLALEALEYLGKPITQGWDAGTQQEKRNKAITAIREALAEQKSGIKQVIELYDSPEQPAQQEQVAFSRFLSDVVTAAGLLSHGKTDKSLAARISEFAFRLRTSPPASKPLPFNKEDMEGLDVNQRLGFKLGWKSAEEAHGIKEQP